MLVEGLLLLGIIMSLSVFKNFTNLIDWNVWGFGQVIAITIFAPVVCKYLYWLIFGTKAYSKARIPSPYVITKSANVKSDNSTARPTSGGKGAPVLPILQIRPTLSIPLMPSISATVPTPATVPNSQTGPRNMDFQV
ncbi:hypothetical protein NLG97_g2089 [Lecanicillium saksenae]|uniref:Uncharacterized protein n=1 Tax=Lecanicillium saksenae TaxID=468837 RepID=A0ACC1R5Y3_9HYPO|nr:hypothetical protein NLG97_g2089 [Lecanicillium saksenae]